MAIAPGLIGWRSDSQVIYDGQILPGSTLTVKDAPVDGFCSINNFSARPNADGSYTIQFGPCRELQTQTMHRRSSSSPSAVHRS